MADHILQPLPSRKRRFLLPGAIAVALIVLVTTIIGIQVFVTHPNLPTQTGTHKMTQSPSNSQAAGSSVLAVITNSGSTNLPGLSLTLNKDGSGSLHYEKGKNQLKNAIDRTFPAGTFDTTKLTDLLHQIQDVSTVPNHGCLKSISFGTTTTITYNGKTSGDISCLTNEDGQLFGQLRTIVQEAYDKLTRTHL
jgi:hypothetical protein